MSKLFAISAILFTLLYFPLSNGQEKNIERIDKSLSKVAKVSQESDPDSLNEAQFFPVIPRHQYDDIFRASPDYFSDGFDFPVGKPDATNYYKALNFGQRLHLGEDWNGAGGGNTDLGDPVYAAASGLVVYADDICCGWGNTVRVVHFLPHHGDYKYVESIYAHLHNVHVKPGELIHRGDQLGTIGNARGRYIAHLHFELRDFLDMSMGPGYSEDKFGYLDPSAFIDGNRPL